MGLFPCFGRSHAPAHRAAVMFKANGLVTILCGAVTILCLRGALVLDSSRVGNTANPYAIRKGGALNVKLSENPDDPRRALPDTESIVSKGTSKKASAVEDTEEEGDAWKARAESEALALAGEKGSALRVLIVTAEEPDTCPVAGGDKMLMKAYKNKVDYCRLKKWCQVLLSLEFWDPEMDMYWRKGPILKPLMEKHKEIEWFMWMDGDALFTDMAFDIPFDEYDRQGINIVFPGSDAKVYDEGDWVGLNAGIFLIRNCQFSKDFLDIWMDLGRRDKRVETGKILSTALPSRPQHWESDDQAALVYMLREHKDSWKSQIKLEDGYLLHGYWGSIVDRLDALWKDGNKPCKSEGCPERWPFVTHFCGCKICQGKFAMQLDRCLATFNIAYHFADNQVLKEYNMQHKDLNSTAVEAITAASAA